MSGNEKRALAPRLRFPEFREAGEWNEEKLEKLITTVSPPSKLQSSSYLTQGKFPIIDQSQAFICGWTDDEGAVIADSLPLIIFGDHTCALKFVDKPFAQGADGIKILKARSIISVEYLFHSLSHHPLMMEDYKRHFSILKERVVCFPDIDSGEQQKIADCLSSLDELMTAETQKLDTLKTHKKGLMQQLFPREGETVPRLRFAEFREAGEWKENVLGELADVRDGTHDSPKFFSTGRPLVTSKNLFEDGSLDLNNVNLIFEEDYEQINKRSKVDIGDILFGMIGTIGNPVITNSDGFAIKNVALIKQKSSLLNNYLVQFLRSEFIAKKISLINSGNSQKFIALGQLRGLLIPTPSLTEQQKIANCLSSLDDLITAQTQKIATLKTHKKGLMQQLFPVMDEVKE
jgi:type I restriction enzyme S subunit